MMLICVDKIPLRPVNKSALRSDLVFPGIYLMGLLKLSMLSVYIAGLAHSSCLFVGVAP